MKEERPLWWTASIFGDSGWHLLSAALDPYECADCRHCGRYMEHRLNGKRFDAFKDNLCAKCERAAIKEGIRWQRSEEITRDIATLCRQPSLLRAVQWLVRHPEVLSWLREELDKEKRQALTSSNSAKL